jgi:tetratricopeptide (TPR) repeat protein
VGIIHEVGDRSGECITFEIIGHSYLSLAEYKKAQENYQQAIEVADEISFSQTQNSARWGLTQAYLFQNDLVNARVTVEVALQYDVPENNHNATALHGIIALRQGERETAQEAFAKSIAQADEILVKTPDYYSALDAKGLALCGLAICDGKQHVPLAIEIFRSARRVAPHAGIVKSALRLFDELVKCDEEGILKDVRKAVEGKE